MTEETVFYLPQKLKLPFSVTVPNELDVTRTETENALFLLHAKKLH